MTIRGGGHPKQAMVLTPVSRMGPPLRSFAADAHDCIMVRSLWTYRIQGCGAMIRARWQAPPRTVSLSRLRSSASRRRLARDDRSAPACRRAPITGAQNRKSALTENAPYKACSGFTHVTARRIAQSPKATFVTRLQPSQLPDRAARQLPDQSTTIWVESSSTDDSRLRGAQPNADIR